MKKLLLILIAVIFNGIVFSQSVEKEIVVMTQTTVKTKTVRSVVHVPKVWCSPTVCNLAVQFSSTENCTLFIYDISGAAVEQFSIISDGSEHIYAIPNLKEGAYTVEITTPQQTFEGELILDK